MKLRRIFTLVALASLCYAVIATVLNYHHAANRPDSKRVMIESLDELQENPWPISFYEVASSQISRDVIRRSVGLSIGETKYPLSENVWVDVEQDQQNYLHRYLKRYEVGRLDGPSSSSIFVIETLQGEELLSPQAQMQLWFIDASGKIEHVESIGRDQALASQQWRVVFRVNHEAPARVVPALAALLFGAAILAAVHIQLFREGMWGVVCTTTCFLVPVMAGAPMMATFGWRYISPAIIASFVFTAVATAMLAKKVRSYRPKTWFQRVVSAALVPLITVLDGVVSVVSLASISILPIAELGNAAPAELLDKIVMQPTRLLFEESVGIAMLLAFAGGLYRYKMDVKKATGFS